MKVVDRCGVGCLGRGRRAVHPGGIDRSRRQLGKPPLGEVIIAASAGGTCLPKPSGIPNAAVDQGRGGALVRVHRVRRLDLHLITAYGQLFDPRFALLRSSGTGRRTNGPARSSHGPD